nr:Fic/DOC family N-terminal domain-containing protein [Ammoniphilus resinae]
MLPLSDEIVNQISLIRKLIDANKSIVEYQTLLNNSKLEPQYLLRPVMLKEAVQSTKIEGTQVTLDEVMEVEAQSRKVNKDTQEAINYYRALNEGLELLRNLPISSRLFKIMHSTLLGGKVRGANRTPGEFRRIQNFLGPEGCTIETATYIPPEPQLLDQYLSNLDQYINDPTDNYDELIRIAIIHAQFETIHPFLDGNGRIGRILIPLYLYNKEVINYPNFFISDVLERDKHKYYRFLNDTRYKQNWNQWIGFFLDCIHIQAKRNVELIRDINDLYEEDMEKSAKIINSSNILKVMNVMFQRPIFTSKSLAAETGISEPTIRRYLNRLEEEKIIFSDGKIRSKTYYYYSLLDKLR